MNKHPNNRQGSDELSGLLHRHDLLLPPSAHSLAALEDRIMARVKTQPQRSIPAGMGWLPGMAEQPWAIRSAGLLAVLVLLLGFTVGRDFSTLSSENTDASALYTSTGATPWQSFITTASSEESDDSTDDSGE